MKNFCLKQTVIGRWIIGHPRHEWQAWSGARWVPVDMRGNGIHVQVCNFALREEAQAYAEQHVRAA